MLGFGLGFIGIGFRDGVSKYALGFPLQAVTREVNVTSPQVVSPSDSKS